MSDSSPGMCTPAPLIASHEGQGFVVNEDDCVGNTRKGKQVLGRRQAIHRIFRRRGPLTEELIAVSL